MTICEIDNEQLEQLLKKCDGVHYVKVDGDGHHYDLIIASDAFVGKTKVQRQQWVYAQLKSYIITGSLHAISMKTYTIQEWENNRG